MAKGLSGRGIRAIHRYTDEQLERALDKAWYVVATAQRRVVAHGELHERREEYDVCTLFIAGLENRLGMIRRRAELAAQAAAVEQALEQAEQENRRQLAELQPLGLTCTPGNDYSEPDDEEQSDRCLVCVQLASFCGQDPAGCTGPPPDGEQNSEAWARKWVDGLRHPR